jgi:hypothetical protein
MEAGKRANIHDGRLHWAAEELPSVSVLISGRDTIVYMSTLLYSSLLIHEAKAATLYDAHVARAESGMFALLVLTVLALSLQSNCDDYKDYIFGK